MTDPIYNTVDDPFASNQTDPFANPDPMQDPGVSTVLSYEEPSILSQPNPNGIDSPRQDLLQSGVGRIQSQDGLSFLDLDKGQLQFSDGANARLRIGDSGS